MRERFDTLYRDHHQDVLRFLVRRCDQPADAADLLHDVFTVAWRRIREVPADPGARMWLFGVAHHALSNYRRAAGRRGRLVREMGREIAENVAPPEHPELHEALSELGVDDRAIVTMTAWEGLTPAEIAEVLGLKAGTVRVRLHRARERLRERLKQPAEC